MFLKEDERKHGEVQAPAKVLDEPAKLLLRAADLIELKGLSCGGAVDRLDRPCVIHAINIVSGFSENGDIAKERIEQALDKRGMILIASWSDTAGKEGRAAEVVAKLREVALS